MNISSNKTTIKTKVHAYLGSMTGLFTSAPHKTLDVSEDTDTTIPVTDKPLHTTTRHRLAARLRNGERGER